MNNHVPDLERCKALRDAGFPQDNSHFVWALTEIRSEDPKHRHNEWILITRSQAIVEEIEGYPYYRLIAAPLVTELIEEIKKILEVPTGDAEGDSMLIAHLFEGSCSVYVPTQTLKRIAKHADTLPNALADLWIWLRERGG